MGALKIAVGNRCCDGNVKIEHSCCKVCHNCPNCYDLSYDRIRDLIYSIDVKIADTSESIICERLWGFSKYKINDCDFKKLFIYKKSLQNYLKSIREDYTKCLCDVEIQTIIENTLGIVDFNCLYNQRNDILIDESGLSSWLISSPGCLAFEDWEARTYELIPKLGINIQNTTDVYKMLYNISVERIICPYELLYTLTVVSKAINEDCYDINIDVKKLDCKMSIDIIIDKEKCKIDYDLIVKSLKCNTKLQPEVKKVLCDFKFDTYVELLKCNLSTEVISTILNCGVDIKYNVKKKCAELIIDKTVILLDKGFDIDILGEDVDLSLLDTITGTSCNTTKPIILTEEGYS